MTVYRHVLVGALLMVVAASSARAQQTGHERILRVQNPAGARGQVLRLSQQQDEGAERLPHARQPRRRHEGRARSAPRWCPGNPADSKLIHAMKYADPHLQMPPSGKLADEVIADFETWIAGGAPDPRVEHAGAAVAKRRVVDEAELAEGAAVVGISGGERAAAAGLCARRDGADEARSLRVREAGRERADAVAPGRRSHADSPRLHRSDRPQADLRRGRGVRQRRVAGQIREARSTQLLAPAAVRRALGPPLARRRALRRRQSRQHHEPAVSARVAVSRLGHRGAQQGCALRPLRQAAARGRSDARHVATRHAGAGPDCARPAGSQGRAAVDRRHRHAATERLGRAARHRDARACSGCRCRARAATITSSIRSGRWITRG